MNDGPRNSDHWISMSGQDGRGNRQERRISFVAANEAGMKMGGLVKAVCCDLRTVF
jgi:hypothetical protein